MYMQIKMILLLVFLLLFGSSIYAQKKKKPAPRRAASHTVPKHDENTTPSKTSPIIGTTVTITTRNGDKLSGELMDLSASTLRLKEKTLESSIALETIATISFDSAISPAGKAVQPASENFVRDASPTFKALQSMEAETKSGSDYTNYGRQLTELRRTAENFVQKYCNSENSTEARIISLLSGALIDYTWARTIWTLKLGGNGTLAEADNPVLADTLALYPDMRTATAVGEKFSADKLIGSLWKQASEKIAKARNSLIQ